MLVGKTSQPKWLAPSSITAEEAAILPATVTSIERGLLGAPLDVILQQLTHLTFFLGVKAGSEDEWTVVLAGYAEDLSEVPGDILAQACKILRQRNEFFPKIKEILDLTGPMIYQRKTDLTRLKKLVQVAQTQGLLS